MREEGDRDRWYGALGTTGRTLAFALSKVGGMEESKQRRDLT